jgi:hypothetical protein
MESGGAHTAVRIDPDTGSVTFMSWDTEGGARHETNLLRSGTGVTTQLGRENAARQLAVEVESQADGFDLSLALAPDIAAPEAARVVFPFDPGVSPITVLPASIDASDALYLPAIVSAPGFGQMLVTATPDRDVPTRLEGNRKDKTVDWILEIPWPKDRRVVLQFRAVILPPPAGLDDPGRWKLARRGWFEACNLTSRWGDQSSRHSAPVAILGNNVLSDPASCSLWMYADPIVFIPEFPGGVRATAFLRRTLDHWLDKRVKPDGNVFGYWDYDCFLDAIPGTLISAWDYVEASGDTAWRTARIDLLERIAGYALARDVDHDGLIEAVPSGNRGSLVQPNRSSCWFDAVNFGHKDAYANALLYRAFCCMADLERQAGRAERAAEYADRAKALRQAYAPCFLNPATGWLGMWRSADGELHDYASPIVNGYAIDYGLVDRETGREILKKLHAKLAAVGFTRFDLGVPCVLDPIRPDDYLQPGLGAPQQPDGRDTWQQYMNGAITPGQVYHFLAAHYAVGLDAEADAILDAMLATQARGGFQNGVRDAADQGLDWLTWTGAPAGYEGFLADNARFLLAVLTRHGEFRAKLLRPLLPALFP